MKKIPLPGSGIVLLTLMLTALAAHRVCAEPAADTAAKPATAPAEAAAGEVAPGLAVGDVLDQSNWQKAKGLLPPEILKHYEKGEYKNKIVDYPVGHPDWEPAWVKATEENQTKLTVNDRGTIIDRTTGKQPPYLYGIPFSKIDPKDPKAGVKIIWNQFLAYWYGGSSYNRTSVIMLTPTSIDRNITADGWFNFFDGQSAKYRQPNPLNLQSQFLGVSLQPADLQGTASLSWRYRDPDKHDSVWAYVPAIRRVRAVSPANRSDGYLGSDISADDGFFFDGKPEDFDFKLLGKHDGLRIVDPNSVNHELQLRPAPGGGWITLTDLNPPTWGLNTPGWKGIAWAPSDLALAKRPFYIVQVIPHDKYYLYGRMELWIDAETWDGAWSRKFTWTGEPVHIYQLTARITQPAGPPGDHREWIPGATMAYACAENVKYNRATISGIRPDPKAAYYRRMPIDSNIFDASALARFGK